MKRKILIALLTLIMTMSYSAAVTAQSVTYTPMDVPTYINSSWKTWMDYRCCAWGSPQRNFISNWGWADGDGFMRCDGERDFGVDDDYYLVAMGFYYVNNIGDKFRVTTDTGHTFYVAATEWKAYGDTDSTNRYSTHNDIIEFVIDTPTLHWQVKRDGNANCYMPVNGSIVSIEKMTFNYD